MVLPVLVPSGSELVPAGFSRLKAPPKLETVDLICYICSMSPEQLLPARAADPCFASAARSISSGDLSKLSN